VSWAAIGAPTLFEAVMVATNKGGSEGPALISEFLAEFDVRSISFGEGHWQVAGEAFDRFGKGRHPAALNYGDCMTYATARVAGLPLLYVGGDFARTDIEAA
jgi:ribonuclease VapC